LKEEDKSYYFTRKMTLRMMLRGEINKNNEYKNATSKREN